MNLLGNLFFRAGTRGTTVLVPKWYPPIIQDYFDRVQAAGGSFNLTSINSELTEFYVKDAHAELFTKFFELTGKEDFSKFVFLWLGCGRTWGTDAILVPVKNGTGTTKLTNVGPFVDTDYTAAGTDAGLKGNGSTKRLGTAADQTLFTSVNDCLFGAHVTQKPSAWSSVMATESAAVVNRLGLALSSTNLYWYNHPSGPNSAVAEMTFPSLTRLTAFGYTTAAASSRCRANATLGTVSALSTARTPTSRPFTLFCSSRETGNVFYSYFDGRLSMVFAVDTALTETDRDALMAAIQRFNSLLLIGNS